MQEKREGKSHADMTLRDLIKNQGEIPEDELLHRIANKKLLYGQIKVQVQ